MASADSVLTHWGRVTQICVSNLTIIGSDYGLSPDRRQAIIWTNAGILLIGPLGTNFSEILSDVQSFSFKKMHLKMSSAKWRPFYLGLNVLNTSLRHDLYYKIKTSTNQQHFAGYYQMRFIEWWSLSFKFDRSVFLAIQSTKRSA